MRIYSFVDRENGLNLVVCLRLVPSTRPPFPCVLSSMHQKCRSQRNNMPQHSSTGVLSTYPSSTHAPILSQSRTFIFVPITPNSLSSLLISRPMLLARSAFQFRAHIRYPPNEHYGLFRVVLLLIRRVKKILNEESTSVVSRLGMLIQRWSKGGLDT